MSSRAALPLIAALLAAAAPTARADPGYYVLIPYDNAGVRTVDLRYWTTQAPGQKTTLWPEIGFAWGVNSRWTTELFSSYIGAKLTEIAPSTLNWQNTVLLTQGELPFDLGLHLQLVRERDGSGSHTVEWGPLLQTDIGRTQLNANLIFEHGNGEYNPPDTQLKYQWQVRYRWLPALNVGLQGFGELGTWNHCDAPAQQSRRFGPALFTKLPLGEHEALKLQAAWLTGKTYGQQGHMLTVRATLDF